MPARVMFLLLAALCRALLFVMGFALLCLLCGCFIGQPTLPDPCKGVAFLALAEGWCAEELDHASHVHFFQCDWVLSVQ